MVRPKTFKTDLQWQKLNYKNLVEMSQSLKYAQLIIDFLDKNPEIRNDLAGIYFKAKETLKPKS